ncbi:unnamed protein product, partial [Polarella glacialis]
VQKVLEQSGSAKLQVFSEMFDEAFVAAHQDLVDDASAIVSLYGDQATSPCVHFAAKTGKPCAIMPCNECVRFFPPHSRNYDGLVQALLIDSAYHGGRLQRVILQNAPFSRVLLVQWPLNQVAQQTGDTWQQGLAQVQQQQVQQQQQMMQQQHHHQCHQHQMPAQNVMQVQNMQQQMPMHQQYMPMHQQNLQMHQQNMQMHQQQFAMHQQQFPVHHQQVPHHLPHMQHTHQHHGQHDTQQMLAQHVQQPAGTEARHA